jgi:hypothetical protein
MGRFGDSSRFMASIRQNITKEGGELQSNNCDYSSHVCKSTNGEGFDDGAKCDSYSDCKSHNCSDGICKANGGGDKRDNGAQCKTYSDCKSNNCDEGVCKGR